MLQETFLVRPIEIVYKQTLQISDLFLKALIELDSCGSLLASPLHRFSSQVSFSGLHTALLSFLIFLACECKLRMSYTFIPKNQCNKRKESNSGPKESITTEPVLPTQCKSLSMPVELTTKTIKITTALM